MAVSAGADGMAVSVLAVCFKPSDVGRQFQHELMLLECAG